MQPDETAASDPQRHAVPDQEITPDTFSEYTSLGEVKSEFDSEEGQGFLGLQLQVHTAAQIRDTMRAAEEAGCVYSLIGNRRRRPTSATFFVSGSKQQLQQVVEQLSPTDDNDR